VQRLFVGRGGRHELLVRGLPGAFVGLGLARGQGQLEHRVRVDAGIGKRLLLGRDRGVVPDDRARTAPRPDLGEVLLRLDDREMAALDLVALGLADRTRREGRLDARQLEAPIRGFEVDVDAVADLGAPAGERDVRVDELREVQSLRNRLGIECRDQRLDAAVDLHRLHERRELRVLVLRARRERSGLRARGFGIGRRADLHAELLELRLDALDVEAAGRVLGGQRAARTGGRGGPQ
jgi:hypothetical protein